MTGGWVKLYRELLEKPIWQESTPEQKVVLLTLLLMANHGEKEWEWKGELYKIAPGQFVTSLENIQKKCGKGVSLQNVRTALKRFEKYNFLTNESTNRNRRITIVNWGLYQGLDEPTNNQTNKQLTGNQQATNKQLTTNKNVKKEKNEKNDKNISSPPVTDNKNNINVFQEIEKNFGRPLSPIEFESIAAWQTQDHYPDDLILVALQEAVLNQAYSLKYIDRILLSWERKGIRTKQQAVDAITSRRNAKVADQQQVNSEPLPEISLHNWLEPENEGGNYNE